MSTVNRAGSLNSLKDRTNRRKNRVRKLAIESLESRIQLSIGIESIEAPEQIRSGTSASFSALAVDPEEGAINYEWNFRDGTIVSGIGLTSVTHTFSDTGLAVVGLTVTDEDGNVDRQAISTWVRPPLALMVESGPDVNANVGQPLTFAGSFTFPSGGISALDAEWDMDYDGSFSATISDTLTPVHSFTAPGNYQVALRITDPSSGVSVISTSMINVRYQGPTVTMGTAPSAAIGSPTVFSATYTDPDGTVSPSGIAWDFDFNGTFAPDVTGTLTPSWFYEDSGAYLVAVRITDNHGMTDIATVGVYVAGEEEYPYIHVGGPSTVAQGDYSAFQLSYKFDGPAPTVVEWDLDYDGITFTADGTLNGRLSASKVFDSPGTYVVATRIVQDSQVHISTTSVTVQDPRPVVVVPTHLTIDQGQSLTLSATITSGGSPTIEWDFDYDGVTFDPEPSAAGLLSPSHVYVASQRYYPAIRVSYGGVRTTIRKIAVDVQSVDPTASVVYAGPAYEGTPIQFTVSNFADVNPNADFDFLVDWSGTGDEFEHLNEGEYTVTGSGTGKVITFSRTFDDDSGSGTFPVIVRILDMEGGFFEIEGGYKDYALSIPVLNKVPTVVTGISYPIAQGAPILIRGTDASHRDMEAGLTYFYRIDGGSWNSTTASEIFLPDYTSGAYWVEVYAVDKDNGVGPIFGAMAGVEPSQYLFAHDSGNGGRIQVSWAGNTIILASGNYYYATSPMYDLHITLLDSNSSYSIATNTNIATLDYAGGVHSVKVTINMWAESNYSVAPFGYGNIGDIYLPPGSESEGPTTLNLNTPTNVGNIRVDGYQGMKSWATGAITVNDVSGTISGFDRLTSLVASGWIHDVETREGIDLLVAFGIEGRVQTTADELIDLDALPETIAYVGAGGIQDEVRFGRLKSLELKGDAHRIYVRKLTDEIVSSVAGDIDFLYIGETVPGTEIRGKSGTISEVVYDADVRANLPVISHFDVLAITLMLFPEKTARDRLIEMLPKFYPKSWHAHHTLMDRLEDRFKEINIDVHAPERMRLVDPWMHLNIITPAEREWKNQMLKVIPNLTESNFWQRVPLNEVIEFADRMDEVLGDYMIKAGDTQERVNRINYRVNLDLEDFENKVVMKKHYLIGKACPWLAKLLTILNMFSIFSTVAEGAQVASKIALKPPEVAEAFNDFYRSYDNIIETSLRTGNAPSNLQMHHLVEKFEKYLVVLGVSADVRNTVITGMHTKIDLELP